MSKITKCLRDSCELVRRQTFILLSRLLQVYFCFCSYAVYNIALKVLFLETTTWHKYFLMILSPYYNVQMDYVKWRGVLFLRFLLSLVDESEEIRRLADFLFGNILKGYTAFTVTHPSHHGMMIHVYLD